MRYSSDIKKIHSALPISINSCGELRTKAESHIRRYDGRNDYQLIYVCEGHCIVTLDGAVQIAYPGDCILYKPGERQDYLLTQGTRTYWIHFNGEACGNTIEMLSLQEVCLVKTEQNHEIEYLIAGVCRHYNLKTGNHEWICFGFMQSILALLSNAVHSKVGQSDGKGKDKISELISHVKMKQNLDISVSECADFCNMSKPHFTRVFKRVTGMPPIQFMLGLRIERAKELLDFTDKSVAEIAEACRFSEQNYFARTFRRFVGVSPTEYRRKRR